LNVNIGYLVSVDSYMNLQASATSLSIVGEKYLWTVGAKKVMLLSKFVGAIFRLVGLFYFTVFGLKFDIIPHYLLVVTMSS
jgi:hypothetical protein